jgi:hypothetical protein
MRESGSQFYRDRLCEQITKIVSEVELTADKVAIGFEDSSHTEVSLEIAAGCAETVSFSNRLQGIWEYGIEMVVQRNQQSEQAPGKIGSSG